jgi:hypothetical protein
MFQMATGIEKKDMDFKFVVLDVNVIVKSEQMRSTVALITP